MRSDGSRRRGRNRVKAVCFFVSGRTVQREEAGGRRLEVQSNCGMTANEKGYGTEGEGNQERGARGENLKGERGSERSGAAPFPLGVSPSQSRPCAQRKIRLKPRYSTSSFMQTVRFLLYPFVRLMIQLGAGREIEGRTTGDRGRRRKRLIPPIP